MIPPCVCFENVADREKSSRAAHDGNQVDEHLRNLMDDTCSLAQDHPSNSLASDSDSIPFFSSPGVAAVNPSQQQS